MGADSQLARYLLWFWISFLTLNSPPGTIGKEVTAALTLNLCSVEKYCSGICEVRRTMTEIFEEEIKKR